MVKVKQLLPDELDEDLSKEYILPTLEEHRKYHLLGYEKYSNKMYYKNHKKASKN